MKVLVVDDKREKMDAIAKYLKRIDPKVKITEALSVGKCIGLLINKSYDLIISDITLSAFFRAPNPDPDAGLTILRYLSAHKITTPVVLCSDSYSLRRAERNICGYIKYDSSKDLFKEFKTYYDLAVQVKEFRKTLNKVRKKTFAGWSMDRIKQNNEILQKLLKESSSDEDTK